jgi:hypothetical protein
VAKFKFTHPVTGEKTEVPANGRKHAMAKAMLQFGIDSSKNIVWSKEGKVHNGNTPGRKYRQTRGRRYR